MERVDLLQSVPIFSGLDRKHLERLAKVMVERSFKKGEEIVKENDQGAGVFVITSGKVEVVRGAGGGDEKSLATLGPGEFFGEMALFGGYPRSATVRCLEDTQCLAMTRWDFRAELTSQPDLSLAILEGVVRRLREADARLALSE